MSLSAALVILGRRSLRWPWVRRPVKRRRCLSATLNTFEERAPHELDSVIDAQFH